MNGCLLFPTMPQCANSCRRLRRPPQRQEMSHGQKCDLLTPPAPPGSEVAGGQTPSSKFCFPCWWNTSPATPPSCAEGDHMIRRTHVQKNRPGPLSVVRARSPAGSSTPGNVSSTGDLHTSPTAPSSTHHWGGCWSRAVACWRVHIPPWQLEC